MFEKDLSACEWACFLKTIPPSKSISCVSALYLSMQSMTVSLFPYCKLPFSSSDNHLLICCYLFTCLFISMLYLILIWIDRRAWKAGCWEWQNTLWHSLFVRLRVSCCFNAAWVMVHTEGLWMNRGIPLNGSWVSYLAFFPLLVISMLMWAQCRWEEKAFNFRLCYFAVFTNFGWNVQIQVARALILLLI